MVAQQNLQSQQMAAETAMAKIQAETQSKMQIKQAEVAFEIEKMKNEAVLKQQLMQTEFDMQMQLKGMETQNLKQREDEKEKAKDKRISIQNSQQSKLIEQRKNNLPPIDFESNEDSLDGFDLAEFEPR
jgi:adenylate kinase family enzyme